jgi:hypothetical protein
MTQGIQAHNSAPTTQRDHSCSHLCRGPTPSSFPDLLSPLIGASTPGRLFNPSTSTKFSRVGLKRRHFMIFDICTRTVASKTNTHHGTLPPFHPLNELCAYLQTNRANVRRQRSRLVVAERYVAIVFSLIFFAAQTQIFWLGSNRSLHRKEEQRTLQERK